MPTARWHQGADFAHDVLPNTLSVSPLPAFHPSESPRHALRRGPRVISRDGATCRETGR
jgi:hypothetical protein